MGPSAFGGTGQPFLARIFDINTTDIRNFGLRDRINVVDDYILALAKKRGWADNENSYRDILEELRTNLGLHRNLEPLRLLDLLHDGVRLLELQTMHRRRDAEIQKAINRLNNDTRST